MKCMSNNYQLTYLRIELSELKENPFPFERYPTRSNQKKKLSMDQIINGKCFFLIYQYINLVYRLFSKEFEQCLNWP